MKVNDVVELDIVDMGANGEGIAHLEDYTVFVPFAIVGEKIKAKINYIKRNLAFADIQKVVLPSANRVEPICPVFASCGGCDMMHINYKAQLEIKKQNVANIIKKNTGIAYPVADTVASDKILYYRNKIQLPFGFSKGKAVLGFYKEGTHQVVPTKKCYLHDAWADSLIEIVLDFVNDKKIEVYNEKTHKGLLRHLVARKIQSTMVVTIVINGNRLPFADVLVNKLTKKLGDVSLYLSINTKQNNVILGDKALGVFAPEQYVDVDGIKLTINPYSFFQINDYIRDKIYFKVVDTVVASGCKKAIDAYSGVGLLGGIIAKNGIEVYNIEIVPEAIRDANILYAENGIANLATNICGDSAVELPKVFDSSNLLPEQTIVILDPPRKGCDEKVLGAIISTGIKDVIYISCNPATLSRDLAILQPYYNIISITPYDMFPNTRHVETLAILTKKN